MSVREREAWRLFRALWLVGSAVLLVFCLYVASAGPVVSGVISSDTPQPVASAVFRIYRPLIYLAPSSFSRGYLRRCGVADGPATQLVKVMKSDDPLRLATLDSLINR